MLHGEAIVASVWNDADVLLSATVLPRVEQCVQTTLMIGKSLAHPVLMQFA